jgi:hypothetical protein
MGSIAYNSIDLTAIYNACVAKGVTPASKSVADIANAVSRIPEDTKHTLSVNLAPASAGSSGWGTVKIYEGGALKFSGTGNGYSYEINLGSLTV